MSRPCSLAFIGDWKFAPEVNILGSAATFAPSSALALQVYEHGSILAGNNFFFVDAFNVYLTVLTAFVSMTTAIFSRRYMRREREHGTGRPLADAFLSRHVPALHLRHAALPADQQRRHSLDRHGAGHAVHGPSGVPVPDTRPRSRRPGSISSSAASASPRRCSARCFSTLPRKRCSAKAATALLWTNLSQVSGQLEPTVLSLAFVFLMVGYGTKVGLVPLHNWLPDAHSEGPTPISAVLSGLLLNIALYALVRCKVAGGRLHRDPLLPATS